MPFDDPNPDIGGQPNNSLLPIAPFDGQEFFDSFGIKWIYNSETKCWMRSGSVSNFPIADDNTNGLLSSELKRTLDSVSNRGGHFGVIVKPLLSTKSITNNALLTDKVKSRRTTEFGSILQGKIPGQISDEVDESGRELIKQYSPNRFAGAALIFQNGPLKNVSFTIFDNDEQNIFVAGNLSQARIEDKFVIVDISEFNPDGILYGDIDIVSDSLDVRCIDGEQFEVDVGENCDFKEQDGIIPSGIDLTLKDEFVENLCFEIPGCKGPEGDRGDKGDKGDPGTGDGPEGSQGDSGLDATTSKTLVGIEIEDIDDIFDTAVIGFELDGPNGILSTVKAKIKVPENNVSADQVIANAIYRNVRFVGDEFEYEIQKPIDDPIQGLSDYIAYYPNNQENSPRAKSVVDVKTLTELVDDVINHYRDKLEKVVDEYDREIETYIKSRDETMRQNISDLAHQLAQCEWEMPLEYCVGLGDECQIPEGGFGIKSQRLAREEETQAKSAHLQMFQQLFGSDKYPDGTTLDSESLHDIVILGGEGEFAPEVFIDSTRRGARRQNQSLLKPGDYIIQYNGGGIFNSTPWINGAIQDFEHPEIGFFVGGPDDYGVKFQVIAPNGEITLIPFPFLSAENVTAINSVKEKYFGADLRDNTISFTIEESGTKVATICPLRGSGSPPQSARGDWFRDFTSKIMASFQTKGTAAGLKGDTELFKKWQGGNDAGIITFRVIRATPPE